MNVCVCVAVFRFQLFFNEILRGGDRETATQTQTFTKNSDMLKLLKTFFSTPGPKYSLSKVVWVVALSCCAVSGSAAASFFVYRYAKYQASSAAAHTLQAIVQTTAQTGLEHTALETSFFAEVLKLSVDHPTQLYHFDLHAAKEMLLATHVLKEVYLKKDEARFTVHTLYSESPFCCLR